MSTFMYAQRTEQREAADPGTSESTQKPASSTWLDAVTALVPAEVLAIHAFVVSKTTETKEISADGAVVVQDPGTQEQSVEAPAETAVTVITQPETLKWSFWALIGLAILIYVGKKWGELKPLDAIRVFIAPVAFVLWTMLTPDSAFDAAFPGAITEVNREVIAVFGAAVLGIVAKLLADKADQKPTPPPPPT